MKLWPPERRPDRHVIDRDIGVSVAALVIMIPYTYDPGLFTPWEQAVYSVLLWVFTVYFVAVIALCIWRATAPDDHV